MASGLPKRWTNSKVTWAAASTVLATGLIMGFFAGKPSLLLMAHVVTLTAWLWCSVSRRRHRDLFCLLSLVAGVVASPPTSAQLHRILIQSTFVGSRRQGKSGPCAP